MINQGQIKKIAEIIRSKFNIDQILLFGSYASGTPDIDSDLDLCITTSMQGKRKIDLIRDIRKEIYKQFKIPVDILVFDNEVFKKRASFHNTLEHKISNQGIMIND